MLKLLVGLSMGNTLSSVKKYLQENFLPIAIITLVTVFVWHKVLFQVPAGEGYFYFSTLESINFTNLKIIFSGHEYSLLAKLIFAVYTPIFKDNLLYYMAAQLVIMWLVYQTLYFVIIKITNDKILGLLTTVFFLANYVGSLTMLGIGHYQRFAQRVPNLIPILISFYYLVRYLENGKTKFLFFSFVTFIISIHLSHYNVFLLPIFAILPPLYVLFNQKRNLIFKALFLSFLFILSSILLTRGDSLSRPNDSPLEYIRNTPQISGLVLYQIPAVAFPQEFTKYFSGQLPQPIPYPYLDTQKLAFVFLLILFVLTFLKSRRDPKLASLYLIFVLSLFPLSFMMIYAYDSYPNPTKFFGEDRMYFVHSLLTAFIWAVSIKLFFEKNRKLYKVIALVIIGLFLFQNVPLLWKDIDEYRHRSNMYKAFINYIKDLSPGLTAQTVIVTPPDLYRSTESFTRRFYNLDKTTFIALEDDWVKLVAETKVDQKNVFVLDYKYARDLTNTIDPLTVTIIDRSEDFRSGKIIEPYPR